MTPKEFEEKMLEISNNYDEEGGHGMADDLMCELLTSLGYKNGVEIFDNMTKWYA